MTAVDAHELTKTRDCPTPGCTREAGPTGFCSRCERLPAGNGHGRVRFESTGLVLSGELDDDELQVLLRRLGRMDSAIAWWLGDALVLAHRRWERWGTSWGDVLAELGIARSTASHYRWVCRAVPIERRRPSLSFNHHRWVASLTPAEQEAWLDRAERERLSVKSLEAALRAVEAGNRKRPAPDLEQVQLRIVAPGESIARWRAAAAKRGGSLPTLAVEALDALTRGVAAG
jgi:hypothetical protein